MKTKPGETSQLKSIVQIGSQHPLLMPMLLQMCSFMVMVDAGQ